MPTHEFSIFTTSEGRRWPKFLCCAAMGRVRRGSSQRPPNASSYVPIVIEFIIGKNVVKTGPNGIALLKQFEGCQLAPYLDTGGVWTVGYGHTGSDIDQCTVATQDQADAWLAQDLQRAEACVNGYVTAPINQNQFDALVDFAYNVGTHALQGSTLLKYLNLQKYQLADSEFLKWNHDNGQIKLGLTRRRQAERALFLTPA